MSNEYNPLNNSVIETNRIFHSGQSTFQPYNAHVARVHLHVHLESQGSVLYRIGIDPCLGLTMPYPTNNNQHSIDE
jgi:hypothetical protein